METWTLYLDAAGDTGWPDPFGKSRTGWYVIAGIALKPADDLRAKSEAEKILEKYIPASERAKWPDNNYEIHYHDIIYGKNVFSHLQDYERKELADKVFDLLLSLKPILFATAINKIQHRRRYGGRAWPVKTLGMQATIHRFSMFLEREDHIGSAIVDEEEYKKDKELRTMIHELRRYGATIRGINYQPSKENKLKRMLNAISLSPSEMSTGIQLADVCSRTIWSNFEKSKGDRYQQIKPLFDRDASRVFEPSIIPPTMYWT